ncbi:MAG: MMPL family transporter, partial [Planctomycetes bacterium]|nr:MMPL family transporter [Planctomycetota bacterium]
MPTFLDLPLRFPRATLLALALVSALLAIGLRNTAFDPSTEKVFPKGHEDVAFYETFRETFGSDESVFIALAFPDGDVFSPERLALAREIARSLEATDGLGRGFSLADVPVLGLNPLTGAPALLPGLPPDVSEVTSNQLASWKAQALNTPLVDRLLVSRDQRATLVMALAEKLPTGPEGAAKNQALVQSVQTQLAALRAAHPEVRFHLAGTPVLKARIMNTVREDLMRFAAPLTLLAAVAAWIVLRSLIQVGLVLTVLLLSNAWIMGALGWLEIPIDSMTSLVPSLVLVIGVADAIHILVDQRLQARLHPGSGADTMRRALEHVWRPCGLTSLTTALGFGSLVTSPVGPISTFGVVAAGSALVALVISFTLLPAAAALLPAPAAELGPTLRLGRTSRLHTHRPLLWVFGGLLLTAFAAAGARSVKVDTNFLHFFPDDSPAVVDVEAIEAAFIGVGPAELVLQGPPDFCYDPAVLRATHAFERELEQHPLVDLAVSVADFAVAANARRTGREEVPPTRAKLEELEHVLERLSGGKVPTEHMLSRAGGLHPGEEWLRISVRAKSAGSAAYDELAVRIRELSAKHFQTAELAPLKLKLRATGATFVFSQTADTILYGQIESFLYAFGMITLVLCCALRSPLLGLLSVVPNLLPIAAILAVMGFGGIPLNSFNSMVISVAIGIAVDDTIHVLAGFKRLSASAPAAQAIVDTVAREGAAIVTTSAVLTAGFAVLLLGEFLPTRHFGLLVGSSIAAALLGDLFMLPALLRVVYA